MPRYGGNATHMPTEFVAPDDNRHEGWCSGDWTLGMISDKVNNFILTNEDKFIPILKINSLSS